MLMMYMAITPSILPELNDISPQRSKRGSCVLTIVSVSQVGTGPLKLRSNLSASVYSTELCGALVLHAN